MGEEESKPELYIKDLTKPIATRKNDESRINASIIVTNRDLLKQAQAYRDRLIEEGYDVQFVTYYPNGLTRDLANKHTILHDSKELKEAINHVISSSDKTGLLSIFGHGNELSDDLSESFDEYTLSRMLLDNGLDLPDLKELMIRIEGCKMARQNEENDSRAKRFFESLHAGGAGNFLGVANTEELTTRTYTNVQNEESRLIAAHDKLNSLYESKKQLEQELELGQYGSDIDDLKKELFNHQKKEKIKKLNHEIFIIEHALETSLGYKKLKKSDSLVLEEFKLPSGEKEKFVNHPRLLSRDGQKFEFTRFFVAPIKAIGVSLVTVVDNIMDLMVQSERGKGIVQRAFRLPEDEHKLPTPPNQSIAQRRRKS